MSITDVLNQMKSSCEGFRNAERNDPEGDNNQLTNLYRDLKDNSSQILVLYRQELIPQIRQLSADLQAKLAPLVSNLTNDLDNLTGDAENLLTPDNTFDVPAGWQNSVENDCNAFENTLNEIAAQLPPNT